jgi:hypothetical protein
LSIEISVISLKQVIPPLGSHSHRPTFAGVGVADGMGIAVGEMVDEKVTVAVGSATTGAGVSPSSAQEVRTIITKIKKSESIYLFMENSFKNEDIF